MIFDFLQVNEKKPLGGVIDKTFEDLVLENHEEVHKRADNNAYTPTTDV